MGRTLLPANGTAVATFPFQTGQSAKCVLTHDEKQSLSALPRAWRAVELCLIRCDSLAMFSAGLVLGKVLSKCTHNLFMGPVS